MQSAKSANSQRNSVVGEVEGQQPSATPTTKVQNSLVQQPVSEATELATPPPSPETPVKSKPAAPYFSQDTSESSPAPSDEEGEGLGPEASVLLDDNTRIDLKVVLPGDLDEGNGCGLEDEKADELGSEANLLRFSETTAEQLPTAGGENSEGEESNEGQEVVTVEQEVDLNGQEVEEQDVLPELKPRKGSGTASKRSRSETESGRKVSLASLVGRVRSQTVHDSAKDKHLANKVGHLN